MPWIFVVCERCGHICIYSAGRFTVRRETIFPCCYCWTTQPGHPGLLCGTHSRQRKTTSKQKRTPPRSVGPRAGGARVTAAGMVRRLIKAHLRAAKGKRA
jgi:hypothetical protein